MLSEAPGLGAGPEDDDAGRRSMTCEHRHDAGTVELMEPPDPAEQRPVDDVGHAGFGIDPPAVPQAAPDDAHEERASREVEEDHRVRRRDALVEGREPHRVEHPAIGPDCAVMGSLPFLPLRPRAILPPEEVALHHWDPLPVSDSARERRLPGAGAADHGNALHRRQAVAWTRSWRGRRRETICETPSPPIVTP